MIIFIQVLWLSLYLPEKLGFVWFVLWKCLYKNQVDNIVGLR